MAENKMKEVAELLDIELGVPFKVKYSIHNPYILTEEKLIDCDGCSRSEVLKKLLTGEYGIEQSILTEVEKNYLENVIRPFKDVVYHVAKFCENNQEWIYVELEGINEDREMIFPSFEKNIMYKDMEIDKFYTLEELGLFQD